MKEGTQSGPFFLPHTPKPTHNGRRGLFHGGGDSNCGLCAEQNLSALLSLTCLLTLPLLITSTTAESAGPLCCGERNPKILL